MTRFPSCGLNVTTTVPLTTAHRGTVLKRRNALLGHSRQEFYELLAVCFLTR